MEVIFITLKLIAMEWPVLLTITRKNLLVWSAANNFFFWMILIVAHFVGGVGAVVSHVLANRFAYKNLYYRRLAV